MELGHIVKEYRLQNGLTQAELANRDTNLTASLVSKAELATKYSPQYQTIQAFSNAMGMTVDNLIQKMNGEEA